MISYTEQNEWREIGAEGSQTLENYSQIRIVKLESKMGE